MNLFWQNIFQTGLWFSQINLTLSEDMKRSLIFLVLRLTAFLIAISLSLLCSRFLLVFIRNTFYRSVSPEQAKDYDQVIQPVWENLITSVNLILVTASLSFIQAYENLYRILQFFGNLAITISLAILFANITKKLIRIYGINLVQRISPEVNDIVIIFENAANAIIGFFAALIFAQSQNFNLIALLTGLGIGGVAVAFAAQEALGQLLATIVLYLDKPYLPGEYIRINFNINNEDVYGRVESIGLRSTKLRIAVSNTLLIVPNSVMVAKDIENISRGSKVMVLLYLDFETSLNEGEKALSYQIISDRVNNIFGIDPGSHQIEFFQLDDRPGTRARVNFFILGTSESSISLRKHLVELTNTSIRDQLKAQGLMFTLQDPTLYVDSPVTL